MEDGFLLGFLLGLCSILIWKLYSARVTIQGYELQLANFKTATTPLLNEKTFNDIGNCFLLIYL